MSYSNEIIQEIKQRNNILNIVSRYAILQQSGDEWFCNCPLHREKTPSFVISNSKQTYYCYGCGKSGDVITFLMDYTKHSFSEVIEELAYESNMSLAGPIEDDYDFLLKKERLLQINKDAASYYFYTLRSNDGTIGYKYFQERGLDESTMQRFGLGYSLGSNQTLLNFLRKKGYSDIEIKEAGLINIDETFGPYDKFTNRVMFPIQDVRGKVIGFGGRVMGDAKPKYLNSPETMIFDKSRNLYGLNIASTSQKDNIIMCEGYMDVISVHQAGFNQAVASLGTSLTPGQADLLSKYTKNILLMYDSDEPGVKASIRAIPILARAGLNIKVVSLAPYKDPDEFILKLGVEEFQKRLDSATPSLTFLSDLVKKRFDVNTMERKEELFKTISEEISATN